MARRIESVFLDGLAGRLEALIEEPGELDPVHAVVVCHPHPQHGGTLHNKVVYRMARGFRRAGAVALRFNYRGVNLSEGKYDHGVGELEDARTAMDYLRARYPALPFSLAGFSFGSRIILKLGCATENVSRLVAVGYPAALPANGDLGDCAAPRIFIQSTNDEFGPADAMEAYFRRLREPKKLIWITARDHFFNGGLEELEEAVYRLGETGGG